MKTTPYSHQAIDFQISKELPIYGIWWEQGTGKSKLIIDTACHLFLLRKITGLLVIAPNYVHSNFLSQEVPTHIWDEVDYEGVTYYTEKSSTRKLQDQLIDVTIPSISRLSILVISFSALRTDKGFEAAQNFLKSHKAMGVVDECTAIAEPTSKVTKKCHLLSQLALYRRVMSGTPVAEGPFKIYSAIKWLDKNFWKQHGMDSYFIFKQEFGTFKTGYGAGRTYQELVEYKNLDRLHKIISSISTRVLKENVLDLPPKVYSKLEFDLTDKQRKMYDELKSQLTAEIDSNHRIEVRSALIKIMRLQQICSGFAVTQEFAPITVGDIVICQVPGKTWQVNGEIIEINGTSVRIRGTPTSGLEQFELINSVEENFWIESSDPKLFRIAAVEEKTIDLFPDGNNPRLQTLLSYLEPITHKVIIWGRFRREIDLIYSALGKRAVRFDGSVNSKDKEIALERFRNDPSIQYFVANTYALSMGVTLVQAKTIIYYSNHFGLEKRLQSEDRAHRIGQTMSVNIVDMIARKTVDEHIANTLRKKFDVAAQVMGDRVREWIS